MPNTFYMDEARLCLIMIMICSAVSLVSAAEGKRHAYSVVSVLRRKVCIWQSEFAYSVASVLRREAYVYSVVSAAEGMHSV